MLLSDIKNSLHLLENSLIEFINLRMKYSLKNIEEEQRLVDASYPSEKKKKLELEDIKNLKNEQEVPKE